MFAGDDVEPHRDFFLVNPGDMTQVVAWFLRHAAADAALHAKVGKLFSFFVDGGALLRECATTHCEVAEMFARRLGFNEATQHAVRYLYEQWNGKGMVYRTSGPSIPITARVLHLAQAVEVAHHFGDRTAADALARERRGSDFDPTLVDAFLDASGGPAFWSPVEGDAPARDVMDMAPASGGRPLGEADVETVCEALADFADIKAMSSWHHSPAVADAAAQMSRHLGLGDPEVTLVRRAALVHDVGKSAVPCGILVKQGPLSESEQERLRLHPYYVERVLGKVQGLRGLAPLASAHHERFDGTGFHRQLAGEQIPLGGRIIALADAYARQLRNHPSPDPARALADLRPAVGSEFDPACYAALAGATSAPGTSAPVRTSDLTARLSDREVEVLREVARGQRNRDIARSLVISQRTVEHHMAHIFDKLGVTCRTAAVVFAVQNGLV